MRQDDKALTLTNLDHEAEFRDHVIAGLSQYPKQLSSMYLYDERGSQLFDAICELDEYYPTRTEMGIMRRHIDEMVGWIGPDCLLIEYGSGSSMKTSFLLGHVDRPAGYVPIDISREYLMQASQALSQRFPDLDILPVCADFNQPIELPATRREVSHNVIYFPGSTIGNLLPVDAESFLLRMAEITGDAGGLLIGVDLKKSLEILLPAYDDRRGITAAFNLNLLRRINRDLDANFRLSNFRHEVRYDEEAGRVEMHLASLRDQVVTIGDTEFEFATGETIHTENSYKYTLDEFEALAANANWTVKEVWTDPDLHFSVQYLAVNNQ